jgi:hypothetical protein
MKNIILAVIFTAAPATAQEFAADMPAMSALLAKTETLKAAAATAKAAAASPALAPLAYDPREIRFEALTAPDKAIRIYHKEQSLATLQIGGALIGKRVVFRLIGYLESSRQRAISQGRKISIDDKAIALYNETAFLNRMALEEPARFATIVHITEEAVVSSTRMSTL